MSTLRNTCAQDLPARLPERVVSEKLAPQAVRTASKNALEQPVYADVTSVIMPTADTKAALPDSECIDPIPQLSGVNQ